MADQPTGTAPEAPPLPAVGPEPTFEPVFETEPATEFDATPLPASPPRTHPDRAAPTGARVPVAYWRLDEPLPGTVGDDMARHHGRSHGTHEGASGGAFDAVDSFDGIDDCIVVPHAPALAPNAGTLTVWFNAFAGGQATIVAKGTPAAGAYLTLAIADRRLRYILGDGAAIHVAQGGAFAAAEWNQATITWGAAGMALYLNGEPVAADDHAGGLAGNDAPWFFGAADAGAGAVSDFFHGELDDIALYAEQLDADTVRRLFQVGVNGLTNDEAADVGEAAVAPDADSALGLDAIPDEAEGPESLTIIGSGDGDAGERGTGDVAATDAASVEASDDDGVFVFGAGGDYFQGGDGWSDKVRRPPGDDAPAVSIAVDGELTLTGGDKLEW